MNKRKLGVLVAVTAAVVVAALIAVPALAPGGSGQGPSSSANPVPSPQVLVPAGTTWHLGLGANGRPLNATLWFNLTSPATITGSFGAGLAPGGLGRVLPRTGRLPPVLGATQPGFAYGYLMNETQWQTANRTGFNLCAPWSDCWTYVSIRGTFNETTSSDPSQTSGVTSLPAGTWLLMFETTGSYHHQDVWITSPIEASYS